MTGKKTQSPDDVESDACIVKEIQNNMNSLKLSIDRILNDMNDIRNARQEILDKMDSVRSVNENSPQIQITIGKAKKVMGKAEENRKRLLLVLSKINNLNLAHSLTTVGETDDKNKKAVNINENTLSRSSTNSGQGKPCLMLMADDKYLLSCLEIGDQGGKERQKGEVSKNSMRESALQELQWLVKTKLYRLRHHYQRLTDQTIELAIK